MILDNELILSSSQAVTTTAASDNVIDQGAAGDAYGRELWCVVQVREAATADGSATVTIAIETDDNSSFSSPKTLFSTPAIAKASLTLNSEPVKVKLPPGAERYLRMKYTIASGPLTAGKFDAFLTPDVKIGSQ